MLAASDIRRRWRSVVALTLLVGAVGAIVLATAAGARRSDTALTRFNTYSRSSDLEISIGIPTASQLAAFRRSPGVAALAYLHAFSLVIEGEDNLAIAAPDDSAMGNLVDRARLIEGRFGSPSAPDELTVSEGLAAKTHLRVGSHLDARSFTQTQIDTIFSGKGDPNAPPVGPHVRLTVVGIVRRPLDLGIRAVTGGVALLTTGFGEKYEGRIGRFTDVLRVKTEKGTADVPRVVATARKLWGDAPTFGVQPLGIETQGAGSAIGALTNALWIFAAVTALAGAVAIGIVLTRDIGQVSVDQSTLRGLGVTRSQRGLAIGARAILIGGFGAVLAGVGAVLASPLLPLGDARRADPDVGLHADWTVLAIGVAAVLATVAVTAFVAAWRATRTLSADRVARSRRTSPVVETAARAGMSPTATNGLRMALQAGRGETSVPIRSAYLGAVFGVAGITAVLMFAASLAHLQDTPRMYGWTFDVKTDVGTRAGSNCVDRDAHGLADAPGVEAVAVVCGRGIEVDGHPVSALAFRSLRGSIEPEVVAGRAPRGPSEIALGRVTLRAIHKGIGERVTVDGETGERRNYVIVGRIVLPTLSPESLQPLADGASFTIPGFLPLIQMGAFETHSLLVKGRPGSDRDAIERRVRAIPRSRFTGTPTAPVELDRLQQVDWFPVLLAGLLALLAAIAVGHALVTSVRRRRREIALLKTIGFGRWQVSATVAWQATTLAVVGLVIGIPIGFLIGREVWGRVADGLGVATVATMPTIALVLTGVCAIALVNLIAFFPGRSAARTRPAVALREE
jgi:hypothetical protein